MGNPQESLVWKDKEIFQKHDKQGPQEAFP